jgi:HK97 family phage portal protein
MAWKTSPLKAWLEEYRMAGLANPSYDTKDAFQASSTYSGERVSVNDAMQLAAVRSAVAMISQAVGGLPLKVYRVMGNDDRVEARDHRSYRMLHDKPNEHCNARTFWTATASQLLIYENSFLFKERDFNGELEALYHLDPTQVRVEMQNGRKLYVIEGPPRITYTDDDVLHIVGYSMNGYYGESRITQARQTLGTALARAKFEGGFYKRGARIPGVIEYPGRLGQAGVDNLARSFASVHGSTDNMHKVPILEEGATFKGVSMTLEDMQFAELAEQTRTEIAVLFNIPPAYLGASTGDSLTYATTESNQIQFATMAVLPVADTIAKALSLDPAVLPWNVMFCEFVIEALMRADMKTRAEYWEKLKAMGVVDEAYIASRENLPKPPPKPKPVAPIVPPTLPVMNGNGVAEEQASGRVPVS